MKKYIFFFLSICMVHASLTAQESVDIFGYFESQWMGTILDNDLAQVQANKLRLDFASDLSDKVSFAANFNCITYHGKTEWPMLEMMPERIGEYIPEEMRDNFILPFEDRYELDNAYLRMTFPAFDLTVGKQQISLGSGYVWNPVDVFNVKDIVDPTYEQPGHNAIRVDCPIGSNVTGTLLYSPDDDFQHSAKMALFKMNLGRFDVSLLGIETYWILNHYDPVSVPLCLILPEKRRMLGFNLEGELLGIGLYAEGGLNQMETSNDFEEWIVGMNYTFDFQTYLLCEFYRNTLGKTDHTEYNMNDWMRYYASEQKAISQDQLYVMLQHPVTDLLSFAFSSIVSVSDGSAVFIPMVEYNLSQNVDITAIVNFSAGENGKAYSMDYGNGGLLRARVYF